MKKGEGGGRWVCSVGCAVRQSGQPSGLKHRKRQRGPLTMYCAANGHWNDKNMAKINESRACTEKQLKNCWPAAITTAIATTTTASATIASARIKVFYFSLLFFFFFLGQMGKATTLQSLLAALSTSAPSVYASYYVHNFLSVQECAWVCVCVYWCVHREFFVNEK